MDASPIPEPPAQPAASVGGEKPSLARNVSWIALCGLAVLPAAGIEIVAVSAAMTSRDPNAPGTEAFQPLVAFAVTLALAAVLAWCGIKRGWNTPTVLRYGWIVTIILLVFLLLAMANAAGARLSPRSQDKAVLNNARQLAAAADDYFQTHAATTCHLADLVGSDNYIKTLYKVALETYPRHFTHGAPITVTGVAGARTVTYAP
jgi:type IV pilus assembly protein PilA